MDLSGRVAVVSGGASGIGLAAVRRLQAAGAVVETLDLSLVKGGHVVDVIDAGAVDAAVSDILQRLGRIDIAVTAAGVSALGQVATLDIDLFDRALATNVRGTVLVARAVLTPMLQAGRGSIITIGSTFGLLARPGLTPYCVSKAAVIHLTRCMALDYAQCGVRINCVCPGLIDTPLVSYLKDHAEIGARHAELHAMNRMGGADEVANVIAFLASDAASYVTGAIVPVDGGYGAGKWVIGDLSPEGRGVS